MHLQIPQTAIYPAVSPYLTPAPRKRPYPNPTDFPSIPLQVCMNAAWWVQEGCRQTRCSWSSCSDARQCHPHGLSLSPSRGHLPWEMQGTTGWAHLRRGQSTLPGQAEGDHLWGARDPWLPLEGTPILPSHPCFCLLSAFLAEHFHQLPWTNSGAHAAKSTKTAENKSRKKRRLY